MCDCSKIGPQTWLGKYAGKAGDYAQPIIIGGAKRLAKNWFGFGDYSISANSIVQSGGGGSTPAIIETRGRAVRITNREYLGEVYTGPVVGGFNAVTYDVNPGNLLTFPWLNTIAQQYEQYIPNGIIFEFRSTATDNTLSASLGSVMIASEYDVTEDAYSSKIEMMNSAYSSESKMSDGNIHGIECDPAELQRKVFYVRAVDESVTNPRDYDLCKTTIATQGGGLAANSSVGSLYIHYDITFLKEQMTGGLLATNQLYSVIRSATGVAVDGTRQISQLFNGTESIVAGFDLGITFSGDTIQIPKRWAGATFRFTLVTIGGASFTPFTAGILANCTLIPQPTAQVVTLSSGGWNNITLATGATQGASASCVLKIADIVGPEYALFSTTNLGIVPAAVNATGSLTVELVSDEWFELN